MYRELIRIVTEIIAQPGKAWKQLAVKNERKDEILTRFVYPLIGLATLAAFIGVLFTEKHFVVELALKAAIKTLVACFGGFFIAAWTLNEARKKLFLEPSDPDLCRRFIAYSSVMMFTVEIALSILPASDFFFIRAFLLYTAYIVWEGASTYMKVDNRQITVFRITVSAQMLFTFIATTLIIALPMILYRIMLLFMPGLRS